MALKYLLVAFLAASPIPTFAAESEHSPILDFRSPQSALRSYWATKDRYSTNSSPEAMKRAFDEQQLYLSKMAEVTTGQTHIFFANWMPHAPDKVSRTIKSESKESDSRAVVIVNVKNVTSIPPGIAPSQSELALREAGRDYKYVVENENGAWKISEVWVLNIPGIQPPTRGFRIYEKIPATTFPHDVYDD